MPSLSSPEWKQSVPIAALSMVALVPAVCVLWFMTVAMRNERLAVHERLTEVYESHLASVERNITECWNERQSRLHAVQGTPSEIFASIIRSNLADSVLVYGSSNGVRYPAPMKTSLPDLVEEGNGWNDARKLEFQRADYPGAAEAYRKIADHEENVHLKARALQFEAGCLLKDGQKETAINLLRRLSADPALQTALTAQGLLLIPNVQLWMLKLGTDSDSSMSRETFYALRERLNDYSDPLLSSSQRRFLMEEAVVFAGGQQTSGEYGPSEPFRANDLFPTLEAERLAARCLEENVPVPAKQDLRETSIPGVWCIATTNGLLVAMFRDARLRSEATDILRSEELPGLHLSLLSPGEAPPIEGPVPLQRAGERMPGWRVSLRFDGSDPFAAASTRQTQFYLAIGVLVVVVILAVAILVARYVSAQMRLARIKNELVSTVSHELKTPLASMRVLVDTLSAGRYHGEEQLQEYLQLISKENLRLSHLIENFLQFSRMERGKQRFHFEALSPESLVNGAAGALKERLQSPHLSRSEPEVRDMSPVPTGFNRDTGGTESCSPECDFKVEMDSDLPLVRADRDALTTVLINLLDNAIKYTDREKRIRVRGRTNGRTVCFEVEDNGVGLAPEEIRRVFDRFYQTDQSLTRQRGGCGLGLSIVQSIVKAHNGVVEAESEPGRGSTFRVRVPIANQGDGCA